MAHRHRGLVALVLLTQLACTGGSNGPGDDGDDNSASGGGGSNAGNGNAGTSATAGDGGQGSNATSGTSTGGDGGGSGNDAGPGSPGAGPEEPAVARGADFFGHKEKFNRYYTDPMYTPSNVIYVSEAGGGDGTTRSTPLTVEMGLSMAQPGSQVVFVRGDYTDVCYELAEGGGTYDAPIILYGERNPDGSVGVNMTCCTTGRATCLNLEATSYVALDGFRVEGGDYGLRSVGAGYDASDHTLGNTLLNSIAVDQVKDGVLTGASDWAVFERNVASGSSAADGHGIYLSNGSDFNIVRANNLFENEGATFQINADPASTCDGDFFSDACAALAGTGEGGRGASDYMLIEGNYFHHGTAQGSNFTSTRHSVVRNNVFGFWSRHGVSFWSEPEPDSATYNPALGSHHNRVLHNLFITSNRRLALQLINHSNQCEFRNNLVLGLTVAGDTASASEDAIWLETDDTVADNIYSGNYYVAGRFEGRAGVTANEFERADFDPTWFTALPLTASDPVQGFAPSGSAPWLNLAPMLPEAPRDMLGVLRAGNADVGPFERP